MRESDKVSADAADLGLDTASVVRLVEMKGPNINLIARILHKHKESVRYRYRQRILANGFKIQVKPNHERLGLKRLILVGNLENDWWRHFEPLFTLLNETSYFVNFSRTFPDNRIIANVSIPPRFIAKFTSLLSSLASRKILYVKNVYSFDSFTNPPMGADHYDFDADRWDFDWNTAKGKKEESRDYSPSHVGKFDFEDLMLIKELQLDATRSLREIAAKLRVGYKKALRHFHHVTERRLIHGYKITWSKDAIDLKREASPVIRHKYLPIFLLVKNPSISESRRLKLASERLPYLSAEAYGKDYFAEILLPLEQSIQGLQYLRKSTEQVKERSDFGLIDPEYSLAFTISYQLYDQRSRQWTFDTGRVLESVENLMITRNETKQASRLSSPTS